MATWIYRLGPDESLPGRASPYNVLFGRGSCTQLDELVPTLDDATLGGRLERTMADKRQMARRKREAPVQRQATKNRRREIEATIARASPGAKAKIGDKVLVKEATRTPHNDGLHPKWARDHLTGPWKVVNVVWQGLSFTIGLNGRQVRQLSLAASDVKPFLSRHTNYDTSLKMIVLTWSGQSTCASTTLRS